MARSAAPRRVFGSARKRLEFKWISMDRGASRGWNRKRTNVVKKVKMNYGGMRRKLFRASICSRVFPRLPLSDFRRGFVTIDMQFRQRSKKTRAFDHKFSTSRCPESYSIATQSEKLFTVLRGKENSKISTKYLNCYLAEKNNKHF